MVQSVLFSLQHKVHVTCTLLPGVENVGLEFTMKYSTEGSMTAVKNLQDMHIGTINVYLSIPLLTSVPLTKTVDFIFKEENFSSLGQRTNFGSG